MAKILHVPLVINSVDKTKPFFPPSETNPLIYFNYARLTFFKVLGQLSSPISVYGLINTQEWRID